MAVDTPDWMRLEQLAAPVQLGIIMQANGATVASGTVSAIPFQTGWLVVYANNAIAFAGSTVLIEDNISLQPYISLTKNTGDIPAMQFPVSGLATAQLLVSMSALPVNAGAARPVAYVFGLFGAGIQQVINSPVQPLYVKQVQDPWSGFIGGGLLNLHVAQSPAAGASVTLVAGVAGSFITVYAFDLMIGPATGLVGLCQVTFEDTTAAVIVTDMLMRVITAVGAPNLHSSLTIPHGLILPSGAGLKVVAAAGNPAAVDVRGVIVYSQQ